MPSIVTAASGLISLMYGPEASAARDEAGDRRGEPVDDAQLENDPATPVPHCGLGRQQLPRMGANDDRLAATPTDPDRRARSGAALSHCAGGQRASQTHQHRGRHQANRRPCSTKTSFVAHVGSSLWIARYVYNSSYHRE